ncbi:MAG: prolipoprotein diacylglyceryl transferase [Rhodospirillaceae bacterium]|nr:prolipoprotein diacylglyceryl transferase [Rhodospirillaceae bacterium]
MFALPFPAVDPIALEIGPLTIRWYSLAYVFGLLLGWKYMIFLTRKTAGLIKNKNVDDFLLWATVGIIAGGRLGYVFFYKPLYFWQEPIEIFSVWHGGMSFHGGVLGVLTVTILFCRKHDIPFLTLGDLICAAAPIGLFFGRIANFINGELYGRTTDVTWGIVFPRGGHELRHPSQIYEAALEGLFLFFVLMLMIKYFCALKYRGLITGCFFAGYGISRFFVEFFREPDAHLGFLIGFLTMGQILSLPVIFGGIWFIRNSLYRS